MKMCFLLVAVSILTLRAYASVQDQNVKIGGIDQYHAAELEEEDYREDQERLQQQSAMFAELKKKAQGRARTRQIELQQQEMRIERQRIHEEQEELRAKQQRAVMEQLRRNEHLKAAREVERNPMHTTTEGRAKREQARAIREEEERLEDELRARKAEIQRRRILAERAQQEEERMLEEEHETQRMSRQKRYREDAYDDDTLRTTQKRKLDEELLAKKEPEKKKSAIEKAKELASPENIAAVKNAAEGLGSTLNTLKGLFG